jgi:hypothetical protein
MSIDDVSPQSSVAVTHDVATLDRSPYAKMKNTAMTKLTIDVAPRKVLERFLYMT